MIDSLPNMERETKKDTTAESSESVYFVSSQGLAFYITILVVVVFTLSYALTENWQYVIALRQVLNGFSITYTPLNLFGLPQALIATVQLIFVGTLIETTIIPSNESTSNGTLLSKVSSLGFGFASIGLIVTVLSDVHALYLWSVETLIIAVILVCVALRMFRSKGGLRVWVKEIYSVWNPILSLSKVYERVLFAAIGVVSLFIYYDALFFPIAETDSIIYHASAAAIVFYNHGMPLIDGGGVGLGSSANYPLLFSYIGTYYYLVVGGVQDIFLKAITPTMWLLSVLTTYLAGRELGGKKTGSIAAFLMMVVPSYVSYAFQATEETTTTFFLVLSFLFLILGLSKDSPAKLRYFVGLGVSFGAACLSSYQALYFAVPLLLTLIVEVRRKGISGKGFLLFVASLALFGSSPYIKNLIVLHNPVYPFLSNIFPSLNLSASLFSTTEESWKYVAYSLVDPNNPSLSAFLTRLPTYPSLYPLNFTLLFPALLLLPILPLRRKKTLLAFVLFPSALILLLFAPFVRYFWLELPYFAIAVGCMLASAHETIRQSLRSVGTWGWRLANIALPVVLAVMIVFPSYVVVGQQNYTFIPFFNEQATNNYLRYFTHPGENASTVLPLLYGSDVSGWFWLDRHVEPGQKVATFETRVYYMGFSLQSPDSMFYLDSSYAAPLYNLDNLSAALNFMRNEGIQYIFVRIQDWTSSLFQALPFTRYLGSPEFPLLFADGLTQIFGVGPIRNPIIESSLPAYAFHLSNTSLVDGLMTQNVTANDNKPRLYVETDNRLVYADFRYLDSGYGSLTLNLFNPATNQWLYNYAQITKNNSGRWLDYGFIVPTNLINAYTEFGLHATGSNFTISQIKISIVASEDRNSYLFAGSVRIDNATTPKSAMVYLPLLNPGDTVLISTHTQIYNCSVELFAGYVSLNQTTGWWLNHQGVARYPPLSLAYGVESPSLQWQASQAGVYTLVIVWWDTSLETSINANVSATIVST